MNCIADICVEHPYIYSYTTHVTLSHTESLTHTEDRERDGARHVEPPSLPCLSLFIYCLQFFHRTHIDAEKAGCECVSESFPDEGDKVEVISRALMQYDSP